MNFRSSLWFPKKTTTFNNPGIARFIQPIWVPVEVIFQRKVIVARTNGQFKYVSGITNCPLSISDDQMLAEFKALSRICSEYTP